MDITDWLFFITTLTKNGYPVEWYTFEDDGKQYAKVEILEKG